MYKNEFLNLKPQGDEFYTKNYFFLPCFKLIQISRWIFIWTWSLCHITCNLFTVYAYSTFKFHTIWIIYSFLKHKKTAHMYFLFLARIMGYYMCKILLGRKIKLHLYVHIFSLHIFHDFLHILIFSVPLCVFVIIWWEHEHYSIWIVPSFEFQSSSSCEMRKKGLDGWNVHLQEKWSHECLHDFAWMEGKREIHSLEVGHNVRQQLFFCKTISLILNLSHGLYHISNTII